MNQLLIIGYVWPEPNSSAAGSRMLQLIELFLQKQWKITYASPAKESEFAIDLKDYGVEVKKIKTNSATFDDFIKELQPQAVMFDRFMMEEQFGWRVAENCPDAIRILDTEDLHFFRKARHEAVKKNRDLQKEDLHTDEAKREIASILRCDMSLIISEAEHQLLTNTFQVNSNLLHYIPLLTPTLSEKEQESLKTFEERKDFIFIGNFLHQPNWDAVLYLKSKVWPLIKKQLPQANLNIYGAYASQKVEQLHNQKEGFLIKGRAVNAKDELQKARVLLAPLRFGAGIKGKFIDAMLVGTPSITTTIGAEGICGTYPWAGEIANKDECIAKEAVKIYEKPKRWKLAQQNGFSILERRFQKEHFSSAFWDKVTEVKENLKKHRSQNFIGAMLMHHTLKSTKYMSMWIETKNKLKD
ncbi:Glycosyltransferase involved in cell wall bisynthesis [Mesonia phycicola]|uniref:Glycosyltransferase involved in cell wall bisynthesis n=1 Tax=Mesonia phycicola TaxID=579105 RepID=A0A1M6H5I1_9FLAO|nr:glycosyltransferase [Mesonia phycicola]SHJ17436.1 Glycosyltransferase involved in cell wall bisynthesis [Mesonia phycicola]